MTVRLPLIASWCRDIALAYVGGLVLGAPVAIVAATLTGRSLAATVCLVGTMAVLLVVLRRRTARRRLAFAALREPRDTLEVAADDLDRRACT